MSSGARALVVLFVAMLAADAPGAWAEGAPLAGRLVLAAPSLVSGSTLDANLGVGERAVEHLRERASGRDLIESFDVEGFRSADPQGLGSPLVTLEDPAARIELHDDARVPLLATLRAPAKIVLAPGLIARQQGGLITMASAQGASLGVLSGRLTLTGGVIAIQPGSLALILRLPGETDDANARVLAQAFASGALVASATADGGFLAQAGALDAVAQLAGEGAVTNLPAGHRTAILAYDLPSADLTCLLDGVTAARVASAADVLAAARAGRNAWSIVASNGRAFALVAAVQAQRVELLPSPNGDDESFHASEGGRITGEFVTGLLAPGELRIDGFDVLATRAEVFRSIQLGHGAARLSSSSDARRFVLQGAQGAITLTDEPDASLIVSAQSRAEAVFSLAAGVHPTIRSPRVVELTGTQGAVGELILLQDGSLVAREGTVRAMLAAGERVLYRAPAESFPSEPLLAAAIAGQRVIAHVGLDAASIPTLVAYSPRASVGVPSAQSGAVRLLTSGTLALDASRAALPARSVHDVDVLVDGEPSREARSAAEVLAPGIGARHWAEIGAEGGLRILVAPGRDGTSDVVIHAPGAQFGFRVFPDGAMLGRHSRLLADATGLSNFTVDGRALLESATAGPSPYDAPKDGRIASDDAVWHVDDGGALRLVANHSVQATLTLARGVAATSEGANLLDLGSASLVLVGEGALRAEGRDVHATLAAGAQLVLRTRSAIERESDDSATLDRALASGRLAHEIRVESGEVASIPLTGDVQAEARATVDRIDLTVESAQHEGRAILLTLAPGEMPALERGDAEILVDGRPAAEASSLADALDADRAEYFVLTGDTGTVVILSVPHFSVHTVTLQARAVGGSSPLLVYATIFLGALLAGETAILALRRRNLKLIVSDKESDPE